jgi:hypothetical protein
MIYCTVAHDTIYFHWQVEVMLANFREVGINPNKIEIIYLYDNEASQKGREIQAKNPDVRFFFYKDEREDKSYIPSKKPWGMYRHFKDFPTLNKEAIFYHDSDMVFIKKVNEQLLEIGDKWYTSDTDGYIAHDYVIGRGVEQYYKMCEIVGVSPDLIKHNDGGGAQYVMKNTTASYWLKVYEDSNKLWKFFEKQKAEGKDNGLQLWTAEMWATLWVGYQFGFRIRNHKELDFIMAPNDILDLERVKIYHNAGVTDSLKEKMFYKGEYISKYPTELRETLSDQNATHFYVQQIKKTIKDDKL